ncbi:MAG: hypothetical protein KDA61_17545 [Planctomycetales bacterium]|nr:hypothetical protein [Planctomycetales bacterium]
MHTVDHILEKSGRDPAWLAHHSGLELVRIVAIVEGRWLPSPGERRCIAAALEASLEDISWGHTMSPRNVRYHQFGIEKEFGE